MSEDTLSRALAQAGGAALRGQRSSAGQYGPALPPMGDLDSTNPKAKARIKREAAELDEINRATRERFGLAPVAVSQRAEDVDVEEEVPTATRMPRKVRCDAGQARGLKRDTGWDYEPLASARALIELWKRVSGHYGARVMMMRAARIPAGTADYIQTKSDGVLTLGNANKIRVALLAIWRDGYHTRGVHRHLPDDLRSTIAVQLTKKEGVE